MLDTWRAGSVSRLLHRVTNRLNINRPSHDELFLPDCRILMVTVDRYLEAAERKNTRRSYASALRHFEGEWGGFLPATPDSVARYLAGNAERLALNTLKQHLAALASWHKEQGFADPTRSPYVRKVLKGIQALHANVEKRATPLQLDDLAQISDWLDNAIDVAAGRGDEGAKLRHLRDRALVLLGFWRGFRGDELIRLEVEHLEVVPGKGIVCFLPRTKGDRQNLGTTYKVPALSRWCPVHATTRWLATSGLKGGPLFRRVDAWGHTSEHGLHPNSLIPLLRRVFREAGITGANGYSSHSLRRGFAGWANANGWDVKALMEYVGWRDVKSAMRYVDGGDPYAQRRIEQSLPSPTAAASDRRLPAPATRPDLAVTLDAKIVLARFSPQRRGLKKAHRMIEEICLAPHGAQRLDHEGTRYRLTVAANDESALEETIAMMLDTMHRIADNHRCSLEATLRDEAGGRHWD